MARMSMPTFAAGRQEAMPPVTAGRIRAAPASRSVLVALLVRALSTVADWLERGGRLSLYVGLLLVTFQAVRLPGNVGSIADPFLLVSLLCALLVAARGRTFNIAIFKLHVVGLLLICVGVLASTAANSTNDWESLEKLAKFIFTTTGTFLACVILVKRRTHLKVALACWVLSAATSGLVALLQTSLGDAMPGITAGQYWGRVPGLTGNPNGLGAVAAIALAPGLTLAAISRGIVERVLWMLAVMLCVAGVILSASRSGAIVALATSIPWVVLYFRLNMRFAVVIGGSCVIAAAAAFFYVDITGGADVANRLARVADPYADGAIASRLHAYAAVLREAAFLGTGLADADARVWGIPVHNTFLLLLRAGGVLALLGISIIAVDLMWKGTLILLHEQTNDAGLLAAGFTLAVFGLFLSAMSGPVLYQRKEWIAAALLICLVAILRRRHRTATGGSRKGGRRRHHRRDSSMKAPQSV